MQFDSIPPLSLLAGSQLIEVTKRDHDWAFVFANGVMVVAESQWRLVNDHRVVVTGEDHGQLFGLKEPVNAAKVVSTELGGATVSRVEFSPVSDLLLPFSNGGTLQVMVGSGGYENWHVHGPDNSHTFTTGGGELHREAH